MLKFGLFYQVPCAQGQSPADRYKDTLDQIQLGDELGFDNAWFAELHFNARNSITPSPLMLAAAAAQRSKRIRLGVAVNLLPLHNPIRLAEDIATLDVLSDGRAEFGVGRGSIPAHFQGFGIPLEESRERFLEFLEFTIKAWTQEEVSFKGKYFSVADLNLTPKPIQTPHPPIRIASNSPDTFEMVGRLGHNMFASKVVLPMSRLREGIKLYRHTLAVFGHPADTGEISLNTAVYIAKDARQAMSIPEASVKSFINNVASNFNKNAIRQATETNPRTKETLTRFSNMTYDTWCDEVAIVGDPATCIEKLQVLQTELGPTEIICFFNPGGMIESSLVMEAMRLFATEVMPHFRGSSTLAGSPDGA